MLYLIKGTALGSSAAYFQIGIRDKLIAKVLSKMSYSTGIFFVKRPHQGYLTVPTRLRQIVSYLLLTLSLLLCFTTLGCQSSPSNAGAKPYLRADIEQVRGPFAQSIQLTTSHKQIQETRSIQHFLNSKGYPLDVD